MNKKPSDEVTFGKWVRQRRHILDLTQQELADQVSCARITLRRIESGGLKPSKALAQILLEKLGAPPTQLEEWLQFARGGAGLPHELPPLSNKPISNLPAPLTSFIGREKEQSEIIKLIHKHRLITLTGPGGVGKTRLSLKASERVLRNYADGVWMVELARIHDPLLILRVTAITIGLRDEPQRPVIDMLLDYLRERQMLLILDNCEHLLDDCAHFTNTLLRRCPQLKILATSREALGILGEAVYPVPSLGLPDLQQLLDGLRNFESVKLFEERAQLVHYDFSLTLENAPSVTQICRRLDGIPLAIELAAAKVGTLSTEQIANQLDDRFNLLTEGNRSALPRQQTLRASIDWSWGLLTEPEQILMRQLSVFIGGWTIKAAQEICNGHVQELTHSLVKKSLVVMDQGAGRYHFHETIHQYANQKLIETGESNLLRDRHLEYFLKLAETAEPHLIRPEQIEWLPVLDADYENIRLALERALSKDTPEPALNMCRALGMFWEIRCYWAEGLNWVKRALAKPVQDSKKEEKIARARALCTRAMLEWQLNNWEKILDPAEASLALALEVSDKKDIAIAKYFVAGALFARGENGDTAYSLLKQSFGDFQALNESFWQAQVFQTLGYFLATPTETNYRDLLLRSLELARQAGERLVLANALSEYADWLFRVNQMDDAKQHVEESEQLLKQLGAENISINPFLFADMAWSNGDTQTARSLYTELEKRFRLLGAEGFSASCIGNLGLLAMEEGNLDQARAYLEEALIIQRKIGSKPGIAFYLTEMSNLLYSEGNLEGFKQNFRECLSLRTYLRKDHKTSILRTILGSLYVQRPENSSRLLGVINKHENEFDLPRTPVQKRYCQRAEVHARKLLGNTAFETAFTEGQKMFLDEALDFALKTVEEM